MERQITRREFLLRMGTGALFFANALAVADSIEQYAETSAQGETPEIPDIHVLINALGALAAVRALYYMEPEK